MYKVVLYNSTGFAFVDDEDKNKVDKYSWYVDFSYNGDTAYAKANITVQGKGTTIKLHRLVMNINDPNVHVDHKNRNGLDCQKQNLRIATRAQNRANSKTTTGKTNVYRGVYKRGKNYRVMIRINKQLIHLGSFSDPVKAAKVYDEAAKNHFGQFATTNF